MQVIGWTSNYQETLKELGLEDADVGFPEGPDRGSTVLIAKYISRIRTTALSTSRARLLLNLSLAALQLQLHT